MNRLSSKLTTIVTLTLGLIIGASCNNKSEDSDTRKEDPTTQKSSEVTEGSVADPSEKKQPTSTVNLDSIFVAEAIISIEMDLTLLDGGLGKVSSASLKRQMRMMKEDHKRMVQQLRAYSRKMNYPEPVANNEHARKLIDDLSKYRIGKEWDKAWMALVIAEHRKVIQKFNSDSGHLQDPPLKTLVGADIPVLQSHVDALYLLPASM